MSDPFTILDANGRDRLVREDVPHELRPMLATLTHDHFDDPDWLYERKLDGERVLILREDGAAHLISRNGQNLDATYPEVVDAVQRLDTPDLVMDGEVVAFDDGVTSFSRLQQRMQLRDDQQARASEVSVFVYVFDLPHLAGYSTRDLDLRDRKRLLRATVTFDDPLRYTRHRNEQGVEELEEACAKGWEGLIAKRVTSRYRATRSREWLKFRCSARQEFVIGGYTEPKGQRTGFGALLVGYHDDGALRYAGKVGTGYDEQTLEDLGDRLARSERRDSPFDDEVSERGVHFVSPELVAEVTFTEWTHDGRLRHPSFLGLRPDKDPAEVVREDADGSTRS